MASCDAPCAPCCKYGGFQQVEGEESAPQQEPNCKSPTQNIEPGHASQKQAPLSLDELRPVPTGDPPCYLPQPEDMPGRQKSKGSESQMGPIGPWATGRVDWGPLAGLTGTRPVVSNYSITRYSEGEWRQRNADNFNETYATQYQQNLVGFNGMKCMEKTRRDADKEQADNTKRIEQRASDIFRWQCELKRAIEAATEELNLLKEQHTRLKQAGSILNIPESIAAECLDIRTSRLEPDLVRDEAEEELINELALTAEIRDIFSRTLVDLGIQIAEEKSAKQRLEYDWSDKKVALETESLNSSLNNRSTIIMFRPGATRLPNEQSTQQYWEHFTRETLFQSEKTRQKAVTLRGTLDAILSNAARDLRSQADKVDMALAKRVACMEELKSKLEMELKKILQQQVDAEKLTQDLQESIRNMDFPMKVAQTRLDNKLYIPRVECCREESSIGVMAEVKSIGEHVAALNAQLGQAEESKAKLLVTRGTLERELMIKLKNLWIDKERIQNIRSHYPSAAALAGH